MLDNDWQESPPRRRSYAGVFFLVLLVLAGAGGYLWWNGQQRAQEAAIQRALANAPKPVRGPFTAVEVDKLALKVTPVLVDVETEIRNLGVGSAGTGIMLTDSGEVLTNNHVINGSSKVEVVTKRDQKRYQATVVGYDRNHDVALLRIAKPRTFAAAVIGDSSTIRIGEPILGIGNAGGAGGKPIRAPGKITATGRSISTSDELTGSTEQLTGLIEMAADIRPGDSGGPLVNEAGQVIGVNTAASVNYKTNIPNGTGFAIPINDAMAIVNVIRAGRSTDEVHVGPTGIIGIAVTGPAVLPDGKISPYAKPGAKVTAVAFGSPGEDAGLEQGDTIVGLDGVAIDSPTRLTAVVGRHRPGDRLPVRWVDPGGKEHTSVITLVEGPPA